MRMSSGQTTWISEEQVSGQLDFTFDVPKAVEIAPDVVLVEVSPPRTAKQSTVGAVSPALAARFVTLADKMQAEIDRKLSHDRLTNTPKRMAQAMSARVDGERLRRTEQALRALASLHEAGEVPEILADLTSKKAVHELLGAELQHVSNGYHGYHTDTGKPRENASEQALALWALTEDKNEADIREDKIAQMERDLQFCKIPGYFTTPDELIDRMLCIAEIEADMSVLDPSAGDGAILDLIKRDTGLGHCAYEINGSLREILEAKEYPLIGSDFLEAPESAKWDRIIMNPPFERLQDIDHVLKAYKCLADGGRLVAITSPAPFFHNTNKAVKFREFFEEVGGTVADLDAGTFKGSGSGVSAKLITIDKE